MFDLWLKKRRRKRIVQKPPPPHWEDYLHQRFWFWERLDPNQQLRLLKLIQIFLHEKEIVVPAEIKQAEAAKVLVAGAACLMLLGFDDWYCFDRIKTVILTTRPFVQPIQNPGAGGVIGEVVATGVYQSSAPIMLSWPDLARECFSNESQSNVVLHEFAHHIDDLDGAMDGDPPFPTSQLTAHWKRIAKRTMEEIEQLDEIGISSVIDAYGLTNEMEFFAVLCEAFFCNPTELNQRYPDLYDLLNILFKLDPQQWYENVEPY